MTAWWNPIEAQDWLATLTETPLADLMSRAEIATISGHGTVVTYSRKVFIPLTKLCRDVCHYCTFAQRPSQLASPYLDLDEVLAIARAGHAAGCLEALFTLGDQPEARYAVAREWLEARGYASTLDYVAAAAAMVWRETGLL
ncbi:MAG: 7,8-didemethyl-8-hydroxy-5-deazariboflavin synthase, CofG subunit, partial [Pseudomonadota bacterium]